MQGMVELGEEVFHMPVRLGLPSYAGGLSEVIRNPRYSTGVDCCWRASVNITGSRSKRCRAARSSRSSAA
jgi:cell division ATPase FtsA